MRNGQIQKASKSKSNKVILLGMVLWTYNPIPQGGRDWGIVRVPWPVSLIELESFRPMSDPASKKVMAFPTMTIKLSSSLHTNPGKWSLGTTRKPNVGEKGVIYGP